MNPSTSENLSSTSNNTSQKDDWKPHPYQYILVGFCSVAQYSLKKLLDHLSLKATNDSSNIERGKCAKALNDVLSKNNEILKGLSNLSPKSIYVEGSQENEIKDRIYSDSFDTPALISILKKFKEFDTSDPCVREINNCITHNPEHTPRCCSSCKKPKHPCSNCKKSRCINNKCCLNCAHPCEQKECCMESSDCSKDQYACCKECNLCLNCLKRSKVNIDDIIEKLVGDRTVNTVEYNGKKEVICQIFLLRLFVGLIGKFRNLTFHLNPEMVTQITSEDFNDPSLPSFCTSWKEIKDIFHLSIQHILEYLPEETISDSEYEHQQEFLRELVLAESEKDLIIYAGDINKHIIFGGFPLNEIRKQLKNIEQATKKSLKVNVFVKFKKKYKKLRLVDCKETEMVRKSFDEAVKSYFPAESPDVSLFEVKTPNKKKAKEITLKFKIGHKRPIDALCEYHSVHNDEKAKALWEIIKRQLEEDLLVLPGTEIELLKWDVGSIKFKVILRKVSDNDWNENDKKNINEIISTRFVNNVKSILPEEISSCYFNYVEEKEANVSADSQKFKFRVKIPFTERSGGIENFDEEHFVSYLMTCLNDDLGISMTISGENFLLLVPFFLFSFICLSILNYDHESWHVRFRMFFIAFKNKTIFSLQSVVFFSFTILTLLIKIINT